MTARSDREQVVGELRRMLERAETEAARGSGISDRARERFEVDATALRGALHYLGVADHLERAKAAQAPHGDPTLAALFEAMKSDLLIVLVARMGGAVEIPVEVVDEFPKGKALGMQVAQRGDAWSFVFTVGPRVGP